MDHNRRGLALMTAALLISALVVSLRGCNDKMAHRQSVLEAANQRLVGSAPRLTRPIKDYTIRSIDNGVMTVEVGPSLTGSDLKTLAVKLTRALRDTDEKGLNSEMVFVEIYRQGAIVCKAQTSMRGIWVKGRSDGSGDYVSPGA